MRGVESNRPRPPASPAAPPAGAPEVAAPEPPRGPPEAPLGPSARPAAKVDLTIPAVGRPRPVTIDTLWPAIDRALTGPSSLERAIGQLAELGFVLDKVKDDKARLTLERGGREFRLELKRKSLGAHDALAIALEGPTRGGAHHELEGVAIEGAVLPPKLWGTMKAKYEATVEAFEAALEARGSKALPTDFDLVKAFIAEGEGAKAKAKEDKRDAEIAASLAGLTAKLEAMKAAGVAPKSVVVYVDGPDGAGKTSTGGIVMAALTAAGYAGSAVAFKAPTAEERAQPWLQRYRDRGVPAEGEARLWDRGPAGDTVYAERTPEERARMAKDFRAFSAALAAEGVLFFPLHIFAEPEKQAETFGKRLGRQAAALHIGELLADRGELTLRKKNQLELIERKIDPADFEALLRFAEHQASFQRFSKSVGMPMIDASRRHEARLAIVDRLDRALDAFAKAH